MGCEKLYKFLIGNTFEVVTDHKALQYVFSPGKEISSIQAARLQRWAILLSAYDYTIVHKPAKELVVADFLSRNLPMNDTSPNVDTKVYFNTGECSITSYPLFTKIMKNEPYTSIKKLNNQVCQMILILNL